VRNDRPELPTSSPDLEALIARIHQDLRKARKWREGAIDRRKTAIAILALLVPLAAAIYLSGVI
jgi:hypothetical protein